MDPIALVRDRLRRDGKDVVVLGEGNDVVRLRGPVVVVGAGKAAAKMAAGCELALGADLVSGAVVVADGCGWPLESIAVKESGHPIPDRRGEEGAALLCRLVAETRAPVLCLVSGGASSLVVSPLPPVSLADKQMVNELLLASGAKVEEINTVRKHLSAIKGGGLLRAGTTEFATLILSDVIGDDPAVIGSGLTAPDPTTFAAARAILQRYGIDTRLPRSVTNLLDEGAAGRIPETLKANDAACRRVRNLVIGSNRLALEAMAGEARHLGLRPRIAPVPLEGPTGRVAHGWFESIRADLGAGTGSVDCWLAGGETTVAVTGSGRGGRNQEFALSIAPPLAGTTLSVLSAGSDGIDGPTDAAGAFVDGSSRDRALAIGLEPADFLANNDSYGFFDRLGDLFRPGPTGTNVMDLKIAIHLPFSRNTPVLSAKDPSSRP